MTDEKHEDMKVWQRGARSIRLFFGANAAIPSELMTIPGIGKKTATKILEAVR
jgi:endonuclease III